MLTELKGAIPIQDQKVSQRKAIDILLVEDNLPDIILTKKAFEKGNFPSRIHSVRDGEEAVDFLFQRNQFENAARPDIILLDINLPKKSGYEVLSEVKKDKDLVAIPVIMLSSSDSQQDINHSYSLHANSYMVKPSSLNEFVKVVNYIESFWFKVVKLGK